LSKLIEIIVSAKGETQVQTKGFTGSRCREASRFLEQALGVKQSEKLTDEFYHASTEQQTNSQSN
jgi:hypothetical protein